jgi:hypothetical protein
MKSALRLLVLALLIITTLTVCCDEDEDCDIDCPADQRTGALCQDGTESDSTGSGACSGHGGVDCWYCE